MNSNCQCFCDASADVFKDENGRIITLGDVILCKGSLFIVVVDGSIDCYTTDKMVHIYYTADEELGALEERVDKLQVERSTRLVTRLWQTVSGKQNNLQKPNCRHWYTNHTQWQHKENQQHKQSDNFGRFLQPRLYGNWTCSKSNK